VQTTRENSSPAPSRPAPDGAFLLLLGALTAFAPLSIDMYLPAFPTVAGDLGASMAAIEKTLAAFFAGMALGQLGYGPLTDRFGRRRPLLAGCALYTVASVLCALAPSAHLLLVARFLEALGGAAGIVVVRAVVRDLYQVEDSARIYSRLMLVMGVAPILAPLLGSALLAAVGWRAIFGVLAGFGAMAFAATYYRLPETHAGTPGAAHPARALSNFASVLADRRFLAPAVAAACSLGTMFAYITGSPDVLINHFHVPPATYAVVFGSNAAGFIAFSQLNAHLVRRLGPRELLRRGLVALTLVSALEVGCAFTGTGGAAALVALWFLQLSSLGFVAANATALALAEQGPRAGSAAALLGAGQFLCAGLASSSLGLGRQLGGTAQAISVVVATGALVALAIAPWQRRG
jgi:MFS transporter, DHA1 family, multidrug resistance protein